MIKSYSSYLSLILLLFLVSCAKNMDEAYVPSYIKINEINFSTSSSQGSASSYFTDAWVYLDGADMGAYPLPSNIPLLAEGKHTIKIAPGIKLNGVAGTRVPYPMVESIIQELDLTKDSIIPLNISTRYYSTSKFAAIEDFEEINTKFETTVNNTATWGVSQSSSDLAENIFEGLHSGKAVLNAENDYMQIITKQLFEELPKNGLPIFVELNFKSNTTIVMSLLSYVAEIGSSQDIIYLSPSDEWKKIYINLTSTISYDVNGRGYKILFSAYHNSSLEESIVLLDNFKLVYRNVD